MRIYLCGPMRGYEKFNFAAFDAAAARGRSRGHEIVSPADLDRAIGFTGDEPDESVTAAFLHAAARRDLAEVLSCDAIALLEGWEKSKGAMAEYTVAEWLNKSILDARTFQAYTGIRPGVPLCDDPAGLDNPRRTEAEAVVIRAGNEKGGTNSRPTTSRPKDPPGASALTPSDRRCPICDWPLAESMDKGCVEGNCSYRPTPDSNEDLRIKERRRQFHEIKNGTFIVNSGEREVFATGASRNADTALPDYEGFLSPLVIERFGAYMHKHRHLADGSIRESDNWQKGIPLPRYMKSLLRHVLDAWLFHRSYKGRDTIEDALCAIIFNSHGYLHEHLIGKRNDLAGKGL